MTTTTTTTTTTAMPFSPFANSALSDRINMLRQFSVLTLQEKLNGNSEALTKRIQQVTASIAQMQAGTVAPAVKQPTAPATTTRPTATTTPTAAATNKPKTVVKPTTTTTTLVAHAVIPPPPQAKRKVRETIGEDGELGESLSEDDDDEDFDEDEDEVLLDANGRPMFVDDSDDIECVSSDAILDDDREHRNSDSDSEAGESEPDDDDDDDGSDEIKLIWHLESRTMCDIRPGYDLLVSRMDANTKSLFEASDAIVRNLSKWLARAVGDALGEARTKLDKHTARRILNYVPNILAATQMECTRITQSQRAAETTSMISSFNTTPIVGDVYKFVFADAVESLDEPLVLYEDQRWADFIVCLYDVLHLERAVSAMLQARIAAVTRSDAGYRRLGETAWLDRCKYILDASFVASVERYVACIIMYVWSFTVLYDTKSAEMWSDDIELRPVLRVATATDVVDKCRTMRNLMRTRTQLLASFKYRDAVAAVFDTAERDDHIDSAPNGGATADGAVGVRGVTEPYAQQLIPPKPVPVITLDSDDDGVTVTDDDDDADSRQNNKSDDDQKDEPSSPPSPAITKKALRKRKADAAVANAVSVIAAKRKKRASEEPEELILLSSDSDNN
jgi:hypothetical protein